MESSRLALLVDKLTPLRQSSVANYTEERILEVLNELNMDQYELVSDIPSRMVNEIFDAITGGSCKRLDPNAVQEVLDFIEEIQEKQSISLSKVAKGLRYLLRKDVSEKCALLIVDVQNDFISGSLALKNSPAQQDGEEVVDVINEITSNHKFDFVAYSFDWHPESHCSFAANVKNFQLHESSPVSADEACILSKVKYVIDEKPMEQVLWPIHCQQGTEGAELHERLNVVEGSVNIYKGQKDFVDSYSFFWDNAKLAQTPLISYLLDNDITSLFICGLAFDFCVGYTALDSAEHGFKTYVVDDACRGITHDSIEDMRNRMENAGIQIINSSKIGDLLPSPSSE